MRRLVLLIIACATLLPNLVLGYDVLVLQSRRDPGYDEVLKGFRAGSGITLRTIVMSDYAEVDVIRIVREERPRLILAVGDAALKEARKVRQVPTVALMTVNINSASEVNPNLAGVTIFSSPERYLAALKAMNAKRVGVVINPARSGWYMNSARHAARQMGIELVVREAATPKEAVSQLNSLAGKVDSLWMLPDVTSVTRETVEVWFNVAQANSIPLVSFATAYLTLGAAAVVENDRVELGQQAGEMAARLLSGERESLAVSFPRQQLLKVNRNVLKHLRIDPAPLEKISAIFKD